MSNYNEILDEEVVQEQPLPEINPFDKKKKSAKKKGLRKIVTSSAAIIFVIPIYLIVQQEGKGVEPILAFFSTCIIQGVLFVIAHILAFLANGVIWAIGKLIIERTRNRKLINFYRQVYLDQYLAFLILTIVILCVYFL